MAPTTAPIKAEEIDDIVLNLAKLKPLGNRFAPNAKVDETLKNAIDLLPASTRARYERHGVEIPAEYPTAPPSDKIPKFVDEAYQVRNEDYPYIERAKNADPEKKALFGAAKEVKDLTKHIGTEIVGLQLADLNDKQKDELALLVAERVVVFFRDQDLAPQKQLELGHYWGQVEVHPQASRLADGITVIWTDYQRRLGAKRSFKSSHSSSAQWHTDLVHEHQPSGITHLHNDAIPSVGGDTLWASGYAAYDKLSPALQKFLDGKTAIFRSAHPYIDRDQPLSGPKHIEREHPIVRTHPATGWKSLFVNRYADRIVGLLPNESRLILDYLFGIFENSLDIQVRFSWQPTKDGLGTSAIWDNRVSQHNPVWDYEGEEPRHGTRVTSLAEVPYFDPESKSQREALGKSLD